MQIDKHLHIIEHCPQEFEQLDNIISITPMASYMLDKKNIKYKILTPAHDIEDDNQKKYFNLQVKWFEALDSQFSKYLSPSSNEIGHYWLYQIHFLKTIMDILPIRAWQFNKIIREEKPTDVYLYTYLNRLETRAHRLCFIGEPSASELVLSEALKQYGFNLKMIKTSVVENSLRPQKDVLQITKKSVQMISNHLYRLKKQISRLNPYLIKNDRMPTC